MNKHLIQYNCITGSTSVYPICLQNTKYIYLLSQVLSNMEFSLDLPIPYITNVASFFLGDPSVRHIKMQLMSKPHGFTVNGETTFS